MPATNRLIDFNSSYVEQDGVAALRASALALVQQLVRMRDINLEHHRELLSIALWKWTEAPGARPYPKYNIRYVSQGVIEETEAKINHEHVWPRKWLVDRLLSQTDWTTEELTALLDAHGVACVVTRPEHARLGGQKRAGWDRYVDAGIKVWDRQLGQWADLGVAASSATSADVVMEDPPEVDDEEGEMPATADLEQVIRKRAGTKAGVLIELARRAEGETAIAVPGGTRDPGKTVGAYFRIHDAEIEEPTPAVAYVHWNGKASFRLVEKDLADVRGEFGGVHFASHARYGVECTITDEATLQTAEDLLYLALTKLRGDL